MRIVYIVHVIDTRFALTSRKTVYSVIRTLCLARKVKKNKLIAKSRLRYFPAVLREKKIFQVMKQATKDRHKKAI